VLLCLIAAKPADEAYQRGQAAERHLRTQESKVNLPRPTTTYCLIKNINAANVLVKSN
jgi:hypothetical protein